MYCVEDILNVLGFLMKVWCMMLFLMYSVKWCECRFM